MTKQEKNIWYAANEGNESLLLWIRKMLPWRAAAVTAKSGLLQKSLLLGFPQITQTQKDHVGSMPRSK